MLGRAVESGVTIDEFWHSTPRELQILSRARIKQTSNSAVFLAWHAAALMRIEKLPPLTELLGTGKASNDLATEREEHEREFDEVIAAREQAVKKDH